MEPKLYRALKAVRGAAVPFKNGTVIVSTEDVVAFDNYLDARRVARELGATGYELQTAVHGVDIGGSFW